MPINAAEFRNLMATHGRVQNQIVTESVTYGVPGPINVPQSMEIVNCTIPSFLIANSHIQTLTIRNGSIGTLSLNTNSSIQNVTITNCTISDIIVEEITIDNLRINSPNQVKITGRYSSVNLFKVTGQAELFFHNRLNGGRILVDACDLAKIELYDTLLRDIKIQNSKCLDAQMGFGSNTPARLELKNFTTKEANVTFGYVRELKFATQEAETNILSLVLKNP